MRKICIFSLTIGIGLGIMLTSTVNMVFLQSQDISLDKELTSKQESKNYESENNTTEDNNSKLSNDEIDNDSSEVIDKNKNKDNEDDDSVDKEEYNQELKDEDKENNIDSQDYGEIFIDKGMRSEDIANLLESKGIIKSSDEFINLAMKLEITKNFKYGLKRIPVNSSLDEIMSILTKI